MKFLFISAIIILFSFTNEARNSILYDILKKDSNLTLNSSGYAIYLDTYEFNYTYLLELEVKLYNGKFFEDDIYYSGSDKLLYPGSSINNQFSLKYSYAIKGIYSYDTYYTHCDYYFWVPKLNYRYLYISLPTFIKSTNGYLEVSGTIIEGQEKEKVKKEDLSIIIIIIFSAIIIIVSIIVVIILIKKCKKKNEAPSLFNNYSEPVNQPDQPLAQPYNTSEYPALPIYPSST